MAVRYCTGYIKQSAGCTVSRYSHHVHGQVGVNTHACVLMRVLKRARLCKTSASVLSAFTHYYVYWADYPVLSG